MNNPTCALCIMVYGTAKIYQLPISPNEVQLEACARCMQADCMVLLQMRCKSCEMASSLDVIRFNRRLLSLS